MGSDPIVESASECVRKRRFVVMVKVVLGLTLVSIPMPLIGGIASDSEVPPIVSIGMPVILGLVSVVYVASLLAARSRRHDIAEVAVFTMWTAAPSVFLLLYDQTDPPLIQTVSLLVACLAVSVIQNAILTLGNRARVRIWQTAGFTLFMTTLAYVGMREELPSVLAVTILLTTVVLGAAGVWPTRAMLSDLESALTTADAQRQAALASQAALVEARDRAQSAAAAKSRFLANVSHELRTPLTVILGYVEVLRAEEPDRPLREVADDLESIQSASTHLLSLIEDVLDLSKIEAGKMELRLAEVNIGAKLDEIVGSMKTLARGKGLALTLESGPFEPIVTDPGKVAQILINLLGNAIKFTERGSVTVRATQNADGVQIDVVDTGIGIDPLDFERIFEPFERTHAPISVGGTGLGLALSQRLAQRIGGQIVGHSEVGRGSTFSLILPESPMDLDDLGDDPPEPIDA